MDSNQQVYRFHKIAEALGWMALCFLLLMHLSEALHLARYTTDSWTLYELSKTIFSGDFYRIQGWRQFQSDIPYSSSFPPLWPILIGFFNQIFDAGAQTMPVLNILLTLATAIIIEKAFRDTYGWKGVGLICSLALMNYSFYVDEIIAGRGLPIVITLLSLLIYFWLKPFNDKTTIFFGVLLSLLCLSRFDYLLLALSFPAILFVRDKIQFRIEREKSILSLRNVSQYYLALFITLSPYIFYNLYHFGRIWASDNSLVALSANPIYVTDFYLAPITLIFDEPILWLEKIGLYFKFLYAGFGRLYLSLLILVSCLLAALVIHKEWITSKFASDSLTINLVDALWKTNVLFIWSVILIIGPLMTAYFEQRYFTPQVLLLSISAAIVVLILFSPISSRYKLVWPAISFLIVGITAGIAFLDTSKPISSLLKVNKIEDQHIKEALNIEGILACMTDAPEKKLFVVGSPITASQIPSISNISSMLRPRNFESLSRIELSAFLEKFNVGYILVAKQDNIKDLRRIKSLGAYDIQPCPSFRNIYQLNKRVQATSKQE